METESVRSGGNFSEKSSKSSGKRNSKHHSSSRSYMGRSSSRHHQRRGHGQNLEADQDMYQSTVTLEQTREGQEIIEVQILPQDENWGETQTHVTSEQSVSVEDLSAPNLDPRGNLLMEPWDPEDRGVVFLCQRYLGFLATLLLALSALASPLAMAVLPKLGLMGEVSNPSSKLLACKTDCQGTLLSISLKTAILAAAIVTIFLRRPRATMPRIFVIKAFLLALLTVVLVSYWLFYLVNLTTGKTEYAAYVSFSNNFADTLNFVLWLTVVLVEVRQIQPVYCIKVVRSPDGESRSFPLGRLSIQRAAVFVLDQYYSCFSVYNPYLETVSVTVKKHNHSGRSKSNSGAQHGSSQNGSEYKYYDVDNTTNNQILSPAGSQRSGSRSRRDSSHNERFYEQAEYERRVRKRKARLEVATEEAFTHIRRLHPGTAANQPMDSEEAAQAIFPTFARALQKYLRVTRQQPNHSVETILAHLASCLSQDLSPRAFLEPYTSTRPVLQYEREQREVQSWALVCPAELLSRDIRPGLKFVLRQGDVSLSCTITALPHYNLTEQLVPGSSNRFALRLNSETSV